MKTLTILIIVLAIGGLVSADPNQNAAFLAPEIGAIVCDGNLSDWSDSSAVSLPFITWNGTSLPGTTTTAKFAWNNAANLLYVAVQTDEASVRAGGWAVIGSTLDVTGGGTWDSPGSTQLGFGALTGTSVEIVNEIDYYGGGAEGITGVQAGHSSAGGVTTYEIAIPFWADWTVMTDGQELSMGDDVSVYVVMQDELGTANGTNMTYDGNPAFANGNWSEGATVTLIADGWDAFVACRDARESGLGLDSDLNDDCYVNLGDFAIIARNWLECNDPADAACGG